MSNAIDQTDAPAPISAMERWRTCLHEAGHLVCAWHLGAGPEAAALTSVGIPWGMQSGVAHHARRCGLFDDGLIAAAGHEAESLADLHGPPDPIADEATDRPDAPGDAPLPEADVQAVFDVGGAIGMADWQTMSLWATAIEDEHRWAERMGRLRRQAWLVVVHHHADKTLAVARVIYTKGYIFRHELRELLPERASGAET